MMPFKGSVRKFRGSSTSELALKRLINNALENTSATAVLIGSETYKRRWVRYEIIKSIQRGNTTFGVHINGIRDSAGNTKAEGENPFDYLAFSYSNDGKSLQVLEHKDGAWKKYADCEGWTLEKVASPEKHGKALKLSSFYTVYSWTSDNGFDNFAKWVL